MSIASRRSRLLFSASSYLLRQLPICGPRARRSLETLAYEDMRASDHPFNSTAFALHGLLGSSRNWRTFSRNLASELQKSSPTNVWRMVLADLRNHGKSAGKRGLDPPHDMANAARDLANLVMSHDWKWPDVVIGHSMGGKVALDFAASCARGDYGESAVLPKQIHVNSHRRSNKGHEFGRALLLAALYSVWVLDSPPGEVSSDESDGEVEKVLHALNSLPSSLPSRNWVVNHLVGLGFSKSLSEWIGSSLKKSSDEVTWAFDLKAAIDMFKAYRETSYWHFLEHPPRGLEIAVVRAENSDRWHSHVLDKLEYLSGKERTTEEGKLRLHVLPNSGHWVHVDNPKGLLEIMVSNFMTNA